MKDKDDKLKVMGLHQGAIGAGEVTSRAILLA
jgi:hypothetical protein